MRISDWSSDVCSSDLFYGRLTGKPDALHPKSPIDIVTDIKAPVLGQYGGLDRGIPVADVDAMRTALQGAGKPAELVVYPQADHGFMADYRPSYNEDAAEKAFARALAWRSEEHTSELKSLMRTSYAVFCLTKQ